MKSNYNNFVVDFRYHAVVTFDANSLRDYLKGLYAEEDFINIDDIADCVYVQSGELEANWTVKVYDAHNVSDFIEAVRDSMWTYAAKKEYAEELRNMDDLTFAVYSDNRDEVNDCVNHLIDHCKRHNIEGSVSDIVFHVRPIEYGARDF